MFLWESWTHFVVCVQGHHTPCIVPTTDGALFHQANELLIGDCGHAIRGRSPEMAIASLSGPCAEERAI